MLFDPLEEQLDLPAAAIEISNSLRGPFEVVVQQDQRLASIVLEANAAQWGRIMLVRVAPAERAELVADDPVGPLGGFGIASFETQIRFGADDKEAARLVPSMHLLEVDIASVHDVEGARFGHQQVEDIDLVPLAVAAVDETRNIAPQVEQCMQLDRRLGDAERRPRKHRQAQVDGRCIQRIDCLAEFDAEGLVDICLLYTSDAADDLLCV